MKKVALLLGKKCNLACSYCHMNRGEEPEYHKSVILKYLNSCRVDLIKFTGGEPLLYFDIIKDIIEGTSSKRHRILSNGALLTDEMVDYINYKKVLLAISYDGKAGEREYLFDVEKLKKVYLLGLSVTVYRENANLQQLDSDIMELGDKIGKPFLQYVPNLAHIVETNNETSPTDELILERFIDEYKERIGKAVLSYLNSGDFGFYKLFLYRALLDLSDVSEGVRCCNDGRIAMDISGVAYSCMYVDDKVGDLKVDSTEFINFREVENRLLPKECYSCNMFSICRNPCVMSKNRFECKVRKEIYIYAKDLIRKILPKIRENMIKKLQYECEGAE